MNEMIELFIYKPRNEGRAKIFRSFIIKNHLHPYKNEGITNDQPPAKKRHVCPQQGIFFLSLLNKPINSDSNFWKKLINVLLNSLVLPIISYLHIHCTCFFMLRNWWE